MNKVILILNINLRMDNCKNLLANLEKFLGFLIIT